MPTRQGDNTRKRQGSRSSLRGQHGSIFVRRGTTKLTVKYQGVQYSTGYADTAHGRAQAQEFLRALHERRLHEQYGLSPRRVVRALDAWQDFERDHLVHKHIKTQKSYRYAFSKIMQDDNYVLSHERLQRSVQNYVNETTMSASGRNVVLRSFRVFCEYLYSQELIARKISFKKLIVQTHKPVRTYSAQDLDRIIAAYHQRDERYALLMEFIRASGSRLTETLDIRRADVRADRIEIGNKINKEVWQSLPMTAELQRIIRRIEEILEPERERLFGFEREHATVIRVSFKRMCARLGVENLGIHAIRKTLATSLIEAGADLKAVRDIMRHSDMRTTIEHYAEVRIDRLRDVLENVHASTRRERQSAAATELVQSEGNTTLRAD